MSNHARRRHRVLTAKDIFPQEIALSDAIAQRIAAQIRNSKHEIHYEERGPSGSRMGEVFCSCGYVQAYLYGDEHAEKIIETHLAMFHVITDPSGAKYRVGA